MTTTASSEVEEGHVKILAKKASKVVSTFSKLVSAEDYTAYFTALTKHNQHKTTLHLTTINRFINCPSSSINEQAAGSPSWCIDVVFKQLKCEFVIFCWKL